MRKTGLTTLVERRVRGDLIETFKLVKGLSSVEFTKFFTLAVNSRVRGHPYELNKERFRLRIRQSFFSQRIVNKWNGLPAEVVKAESLNAFKNSLDKLKH